MFRSKCRWLEKGERPTKYFFNLEKRNHNKKTVTELKTDRDTTIMDEKQIQDEIESYYNNLYTTDIIFSHTAYSEYSILKSYKSHAFQKKLAKNVRGL